MKAFLFDGKILLILLLLLNGVGGSKGVSNLQYTCKKVNRDIQGLIQKMKQSGDTVLNILNPKILIETTISKQ